MTDEKWQVEIGGQIYEEDLETIKTWVTERVLQPTDRVKKGNLNWIRASAAPTLDLMFKNLSSLVPALPPVPEIVQVQRNVVEHLVIPFGTISGMEGTGVAQKAAKQLQDLINHHSIQGWEFYRMDSISFAVNPGCIAGLLGATTAYGRIDVVIFRRVSTLRENASTGRLVQPQ